MTENLAIKNDNYQPKIKIIGVGGCGINAVNTMIKNGISNVDFFVIDFEDKNLKSSMCDEKHRIEIGENLVNRFDVKENFDVCKITAEGNIDKIGEFVKDTDFLLIINGLGKGTSRAVPVISKLAKEQGAVNIVFAVSPVIVEGKRKNKYADMALKIFIEKKDCIDAVINVSNERFVELVELVDPKATLQDVFNLVNEQISEFIKSFVDTSQDEKGQIRMNKILRSVKNK